MSFSYRAEDPSADPDEYRDALLDLLGDRDPLDVQEELIPFVRHRLRVDDASLLRRPEAPGKWSVLEVVGHLADTELVHRWRMRKAVAEPGSRYAAYDQDAWADRLGYREAEVPTALGELELLRAANLRWLRGLDDAAWESEAIHPERGSESVRTTVRLIAAHDIVHRRQIDRILEAVG